VRIGVNCYLLQPHIGGLKQYFLTLFRELLAGDDGHEYVFFWYRHNAEELEQLETDRWRRHAVLLEDQRHVLNHLDRIDLYFCPLTALYPRPVPRPTVMTLVDIQEVFYPEFFTAADRYSRALHFPGSTRMSDRVVTISEFSRRELMDRLGVPEKRIHVIPPGVTAIAGTAAGGAGTPAGGARVLFVGSIFNRRHVPDLIRGFGRLARTHAGVSLDIVGDNRSYPHEDLPRTIEAEGLDGRVRWHAYVSDAELQGLYARARVFAFLSEYEGLGLTPLEALAAGVPPVLLETPVARESCGDAAFYVPAIDIAGIQQALDRALFDDHARAALLAAAPAVLAKYSWPRAAQDTLAVIVAAAGREAASSR